MALKTYASVAHLMDPELRQIIESQPRPDRLIRPTKANIYQIRRGFGALSARWHKSPTILQTLEDCRRKQPWTCQSIKVPCRDGHQMSAEVYKPQGKQADLPLVLVAHGGAHCMGGLDTDRFIVQLLCSRLGAVVLNVEHRLLPDVAVAASIHDIYDCMNWIQQTAGRKDGPIEDVNLDRGYVACGCSAGGNLISSVLVLAAEKMMNLDETDKDEFDRIPRPKGVVMLMTGFPIDGTDERRGVELDLYPGLCTSWKHFNEAPIVNRHVNPDYTELADDCDIFSPYYYSVLNLARDSPLLDRMPSFWYHQTAGLDMWQDSAYLWLSLLLHGKAELLGKGSHVHTPTLPHRPVVKTDHYPGLPHTWWSAYTEVSATRKWIEDLVNGTRWVLNRGQEDQHSSVVQSQAIAKL